MAKFSFWTCMLLVGMIGCQKDDDADPWEDDDDWDNLVSYSFSGLVYVGEMGMNPAPGQRAFLGKAQIVGDHIYEVPSFLVSYQYGNYSKEIVKMPIGGASGNNTGFEIFPAFFEFSYNPDAANKYTRISNASFFTVDKAGKFIYLFNTSVDAQYFRRGDLASQVTIEFVSSGNMDQLNFLKGYDMKCMRADEQENVYIASTADNGCIVKINASGQVSLLARDLINPGFFDIRDDFLYVPIGTAVNGRIVKIHRDNGAVSDVITDLTAPTNIVIDNYGNFVVRSLTTVNGGNYHEYNLFKPDGEMIGYIKGPGDEPILSDTYESMPMYIDKNNNLYFYHADGVSSGGYTSNYPQGQKGIFKISLIKD